MAKVMVAAVYLSLAIAMMGCDSQSGTDNSKGSHSELRLIHGDRSFTHGNRIDKNTAEMHDNKTDLCTHGVQIGENKGLISDNMANIRASRNMIDHVASDFQKLMKIHNDTLFLSKIDSKLHLVENATNLIHQRCIAENPHLADAQLKFMNYVTQTLGDPIDPWLMAGQSLYRVIAMVSMSVGCACCIMCFTLMATMLSASVFGCRDTPSVPAARNKQQSNTMSRRLHFTEDLDNLVPNSTDLLTSHSDRIAEDKEWMYRCVMDVVVSVLWRNCVILMFMTQLRIIAYLVESLILTSKGHELSGHVGIIRWLCSASFQITWRERLAGAHNYGIWCTSQSKNESNSDADRHQLESCESMCVE